jgi:hypothetical protein
LPFWLRQQCLRDSGQQAFDRSIVLQDESYVSSQYVHKYGKVGRSCGCFVLTLPDRERAMQLWTPGSPLYAAVLPGCR